MNDFADYLGELFQDFGPINVRRMFGGQGVFHDGLMIGLVADEVLYLKADAQSRQRFQEKGLDAFTYDKGGKPISMSYFQAPDEALDDPSEMQPWAVLAYEAALRSRK